jgi:hypothetical protein
MEDAACEFDVLTHRCNDITIMTKTFRSKERDHHLPRKSKHRDTEKKAGEGAHSFGSVKEEIKFEKEECATRHRNEEPTSNTNIPIHVNVGNFLIDAQLTNNTQSVPQQQFAALRKPGENNES